MSGGYDQVVYRYNDKFKLVQKYPVQGYAAGLAPIDADHLAVVYLVVGSDPRYEKADIYGRGKLAILNTKTGKIEHEKEAGYFPHTVRYLNKKIYVTILGEDKLKVYDSQARLLKSLNVGKTPQDICPDPQANRLYVVNTGSDNLSVVDAGKDEIVSEIAVGSPGEGFGCAPTSCAVAGDRLFVTLGYTNAVGIFDKREGKRLGFIPTGWYPTKVITGKEGVAVLSAKGIRARRPNARTAASSRRCAATATGRTCPGWAPARSASSRPRSPSSPAPGAAPGATGWPPPCSIPAPARQPS